MDKITIVTVTFNCRDIIEKTIKSVLSQDYSNIEYIIIDGNSNDGTKEVINRYIDRIDTFVSEPDKGIYDAMNKGLERSTGDWVFFLNSGDIFCDNEVLSKVATHFKKETDVVWGNVKAISNNQIIAIEYHTPFFKNNKFFHGMGFSHQSVFVRTPKAQEKKFDLSYKCCADYNMMMQLYKSGASFDYCNVYISEVPIDEGFSSENQRTQILEEAHILGIENTLHFRMLYAKWKLKQSIKKILNKR